MTPAARTQAAIELLDGIAASARDGGAAADVLIARFFAARRYAGSKDRRAVRELVYEAIRLMGRRPHSGRAAMLALVAAKPELAETFDGTPYGPPAMAKGEPVADTGVAPKWLDLALRKSNLPGPEIAALLDRAPLDLRVNRLMASVDDVIAQYPTAERIAAVPDALRLPPDSTVAATAGHFEIQDAGSQLVTTAVRATSGMTVVDLCAGGGGKTLALAAAMGNDGRIVASDTDRTRLQRLPPRADRAGVTIAETILLDPGNEAEALAGIVADAVLVDAPCSGTGTWRRNPEGRWRLTPDRLQRLVETQARLLDLGATLVRPGGALVHVVCSLLDAEGADQVAAFLQRHRRWRAEMLDLGAGRPHGAGVRLTPRHDATDGFFVARLIAP
jgi:16S rRNA (cytosine967-C5)-methyltransferase